MTLTQFLDVTYAVLVDEHRRLGASLLDALEQTHHYAAGFEPDTAGGNEKEPAVPREALKVVPNSNLRRDELENENALAAFEQMMSGVEFR